jgi:hypothetical protein
MSRSTVLESTGVKRRYLVMPPQRLSAASTVPLHAEDPLRDHQLHIALRLLEPVATEESLPLPQPVPSPLPVPARHEVAPPIVHAPARPMERLQAEPLDAAPPVPQPVDGSPRPSRRRETLAAVIPAIIGGAVSYYVAGQQGGDPLAWTSLGGAAGLLLGWGCLLWMRRED